MLILFLTFLCAFISLFSVSADTASLRAKFTKLQIDALFPGDASYSKYAESFNRRFTLIPAAIVFPENTKAVADSVKVAVNAKLLVSARSGGHSYAGYGLGGINGHLVVDLSRLKMISVDQSTGEALIGPGNRLGDVAIALNSQGRRALPHGSYPYVGLGGHAAFGGFGYTSRQWGLTLDNILSHEVVLADGTIVQASSISNPDLFWALKGAGASYGIVTSIKFKTHPAPSQPTNFQYTWDFNQADIANALIKYQTFCRSANLPSQLGFEANLRKGSQTGQLKFSFTGSWYGPVSAFPGTVKAFLSLMPTPQSQSVKTTDWITSLQGLAGSKSLSTSGLDLTTDHDTFYAKSITTPSSVPMSNSSIHAFSKYLALQGWKTNTDWVVQFELYGGANSAITAVPKDVTSFAQRSILWTIQFYASSKNSASTFPSAGFTFLDQMVSSIVDNNPRGWGYGSYANYVDDRMSPAQWKSRYYNTHYQRLTQIKSTYDPNNVFSYPQSITGENGKQNFQVNVGSGQVNVTTRPSDRPPQPFTQIEKPIMPTLFILCSFLAVTKRINTI